MTTLATRTLTRDHHARCLEYGLHKNRLAYAIITGERAALDKLYASIGNPHCILSISRWVVDGGDSKAKEATVRELRGLVYMLITLRDDRVVLHPGRLLEAIKKTTTTPMLPAWVPYVREKLTDRGLLTPLTGLDAVGHYLSATTKDLDDIVSAGVRSGELRIK